MYTNVYVKINTYFVKRVCRCQSPKYGEKLWDYISQLYERELHLEDGWLAPPMFYPYAAENFFEEEYHVQPVQLPDATIL